MKSYLSFEKIKHVIDDAKELGASSISLSGGEPLLHFEILKIIDYIYKQNLSCQVYTSGVVFGVNNKAISIPKKFLKSLKGKVRKLIVNIEAADDKTYDEIMGTSFDGFNLMQDSVRNAVALGIEVEAHVVPMKKNLQQLPKIIALCNDLGISRISFLRLVVQGRAHANKQRILLSKEEENYAKYLIATSASEYHGIIRFGIPFSDCSQRINCLTGIVKLDVRYDGKVYPCEAFKNDNIKKMIMVEPDSIYHKSLKDIYENSEYLKQVRRLLNEFQGIDTCETCMNQYYVQNGKY